MGGRVNLGKGHVVVIGCAFVSPLTICNYLSLSLVHWLVNKHAPKTNGRNLTDHPWKSSSFDLHFWDPALCFWECLLFFSNANALATLLWRRTLSTLLNWSTLIQTCASTRDDRWLGVRVVGVDGIHPLREIWRICFTKCILVDMCGPNPHHIEPYPNLAVPLGSYLAKKTASLAGASFIVAFVIALDELHTLSMGGNLQFPKNQEKGIQNYTGLPSPKGKTTSIIFVVYIKNIQLWLYL